MQSTMQINQGQITAAYSAQAGQPGEASFSSVWGNEMQREDFLALAAGLRQHNAMLSEMAFVSAPTGLSDGQQHLSAE